MRINTDNEEADKLEGENPEEVMQRLISAEVGEGRNDVINRINKAQNSAKIMGHRTRQLPSHFSKH
jgi:hypothetical protein